MITKQQIRDIVRFNLPTLEEAIRQAELRLNDSLKLREEIDKKVFTLLTIFFSLATILFSIIATLLDVPIEIKTQEISTSELIKFNFVKNFKDPSLYRYIVVIALCFFIAVISLCFCLFKESYGAIGRYPDSWLQEGIIDGDDNIRGYVLANILFDYQEAISTSDKSNILRNKFVKVGLYSGLIIPSVLSIYMLIF